MRKFLTLLFAVAFSLCCCIVTSSTAPPPIPGVELPGSSIDFANPTGAKGYGGAFLVHNWTGAYPSGDLKWLIPADVWLEPGGTCKETGVTTYFSAFEEVRASIEATFVFASKAFLGLWSSSLTVGFQAALKAWAFGSVEITEAVAVCTNWNLKILNPIINPRAKDMILALPKTFDASTKAAYFNYFSFVYPFIVTSCDVGGRLQQGFFTATAAASFFTSASMEANAQAAFLYGLAGGSGGGGAYGSINQTWKAATSIESINTYGGLFPPKFGSSAWGDFTKSIQVSNANLKCVSFKAQLQTDFYHLDPELVPYILPITEAALAYYTYPGCTNRKAPNYDPKANKDDGSCMKIIKPCMQIKISAEPPAPGAENISQWDQASQVWMYENPDAEKCVVSYAIPAFYNFESRSETPYRGAGGTIWSGPQRLVAQSSGDSCPPCAPASVNPSVNGVTCHGATECSTTTKFASRSIVQVSLPTPFTHCSWGPPHDESMEACEFRSFAYLEQPRNIPM